MKMLKPFLTLNICLAALLGDYIVFNSSYSKSQIFRAFTDSAVHATLGCLSSILFLSQELSFNNTTCLFNICFCTMLSSLIDIDHIFATRSIYWKDITNNRTRGILHCTTFLFTITSLLLIYSYIYKKINIYMLTWMIILAYTSHHVRDANRRGLWMYPYGHTPPLSKYVYIFLVASLPNIFSVINVYIKPELYKHTMINTNMIV
ncbi:transmembrane protein 267 [Plodia interpunctella]|uniref:transmembrane protein 267 n=1 Tax=Plodia interpunctella TaxID=58824 RepID=UPI00236840ED|nr:transmembrane protein 267 [Plodia interpunctella]